MGGYDLWGIRCGSCGETSPIDEWTCRPLRGQLPQDSFQCPVCNVAIRRKHGKPKVYKSGFVLPGPVTIEKTEPWL